jgi:hypothetical protein
MTLTTYAALLWAALIAFPALMQRFGSAPIAAAQGTSASFAAATPNAHKTDADQPAVRKGDHRVPPRGRRL